MRDGTSLEKIFKNRDSFVANLVWKNGERLVVERHIGIVQFSGAGHSQRCGGAQRGGSGLDEHIALTKLLGEPEVVTDMRNINNPDSLDVNNLVGTPVIGNLCWHSDLSEAFVKKPTSRCPGPPSPM